MPIPIPIYERKEQIIPGASNVLMPTETPADIRAMQNLGATGINVGNQIMDAAQRMEEREKANLLEAELNKANDAQLEMILKIKNVLDQPGVNPYGVFQEGAFALEKYNEDALKNADPRITEKLKLKLDGLKSDNLKHVALWQAESQQRYDADVRSNIVTNSIKRGATFGDSPVTVQETYDDMIDRLNNTFIGRELPETVKNKATVAYASGVIQATIASGQVDYAKAYLEKWAGELKGAQVYDELKKQLKGAEEDENQNNAFNEALVIGSKSGYVDYSKAGAWLFSAEAREKYKLTPTQVSAINRSLGDAQAAEQGTIMNNLYAKAASGKVNSAIRDISNYMKNPRGMDAQQFLSLKMSLEAGERAKVSAARQDNLMDEQYKATISTNISLGIYKDENEIRNAVLSAGLRKPAGYMETAVNQFRDYQKQYGAVNNFKEGEEYIDTKIRQAPKMARAEYAEKKTEVLNEVNKRLIAEKIPITDPRAQKYIKEAWDEHTKTWFGKIKDAINPWSKPSTASEPVSVNIQGKQIVKTGTNSNGDIVILYSDGTTEIKPNPRRKR